MRTTISIDDDVLRAAHERARREKRTVGQVISELARQALTGPRESDGRSPEKRNGFRPLPHRGRTVTNTLIDQLREDEPE